MLTSLVAAVVYNFFFLVFSDVFHHRLEQLFLALVPPASLSMKETDFSRPLLSLKSTEVVNEMDELDFRDEI